MRFSIIVPVFNAEKTIHRCLDSLFSQVCKSSFEVIAIDDASYDSSYNFLCDYSKKEARLKVFRHESNKRQTVARRTGMDNAFGDYILHVDSDDYLLPGALNALETILEANDVDVVVLNGFLNYPNGTQEIQKFTKTKGLVTNKEDVQDAFYYHSGTKIVRRDMTINMITGMEEISTTADDLLYNFEVFCRAKSIYMSDNVFYVACINSGSLTRTTSAVDRVISQLQVNSILLKMVYLYRPTDKMISNLVKYAIYSLEHFIFLIWINGQINLITRLDLISSFKEFPVNDSKVIKHLDYLFKYFSYCFFVNARAFGFFRSLKSFTKVRIKNVFLANKHPFLSSSKTYF
jgi:glycosyltransferase involved in cell wall biosynthesis